MEYLITAIEETDWRLNELDLMNHLSEKWSNVEIKEIKNPDDFYCFEGLINLSGNDKTLDFALHRDRQGISLDGYIENCALFAVWLRSLVPQEQKLVHFLILFLMTKLFIGSKQKLIFLSWLMQLSI